MTQLLTLNHGTAQIEEALPAVDAAGRITVPQATPLTDNELAAKAYVDAKGGAYLAKAQNLADVANKATSRQNLGWTNGTAGLTAMNVLGTTGAVPVTDWTTVGSKGTGFVNGLATATGGPVAGKAFSGHWTALDGSNGVLSLVEITAGAFNVWTRRLVAGTWDQWSKAYDSSGYALVAVDNLFSASQTITNTAPSLTLLDSDTPAAGATPNLRIKFNAADGSFGAMGYNNSLYLSMTNSVGNISLNAALAGSAINFDIGGATRATVDPAGVPSGVNTIITRSMGDARYLQLAPSPLTTAQNVTATGAITHSGPVRGIAPSNVADFVTKAYADALIGGGGSTGITQDQADALYVNVTGDTMSGNLNIRKTTPVIVLDNTTAGATAANTTAVIYFQALGTNFGYVGYAGTDTLLLNSYTSDVTLKAGTTARAIIFQNGSVETARVEAGGLLNLDTSLVNRKQGDARYVQLTASTGASKSTIVEGDNIYPDYNLLDPGFYASSVGSVYVFAGTAGSAYGQQFVQLPINATVTGLVETAWVTCEVNTEYLVGGTAFMNSAVAGAGTCNLYVETGSVDAAGVVTSLGRTLIVTRTDSTTQGAVYISLTTPATARAMRFVAERPAGGSQVSRFGGFRARRKISVSQLASDYGTTNHAIANTGPNVTLTDTDTAVSGLVSARVVLNGSDGQAGVMGFNGVGSNLYIRSEQKGITLLSDAANVSAGAAIAQFVTGSTETARVEAAGTTITAATAIVTKEKGDARYLQLAGGSVTGQIKLADSNAAAPQLTFTSDPITGLYYGGLGILGITTNGVTAALFSGTSFFRGVTSAPSAGVGLGYIQGGAGAVANSGFFRWSNDAASPSLNLMKTRGISATDFTAVTNNTGLGAINFFGSDTVSLVQAAQVSAFAEATATVGVVPSRLAFFTFDTTLKERMRITNSGEVGIGTTSPTVGVKLDVAGVVRPASYVKTALPSPAVVGAGAVAWCTNATASLLKTLVTCDGTNWLVAGTQTVAT